jgi:hypothetical protein
MRFILLCGIIIAGFKFGVIAIERVSDMQDAKMNQLCKIDASYCQ